LLPGLAVKTLNHWQARHHGRILLFGEKEERPRLEKMIRGLRFPRAAINLAGLPLLHAAACLEQVNLFLGPDAGLLKIAADVGTPSVSVFCGPSSPWQTAPRGTGHLILHSDLPCAPCPSLRHCSEIAHP
jgi:ADP-heptose:LPS heptosyltransferase